ncbi:unnamed protein product, partial [Rhizoctonia solani]
MHLESPTTSPPALARFPNLARARSDLLQELGRLVAVGKKASAPDVPENERAWLAENMSRYGDAVFACCQHYVEVAITCGVHVADRPDVQPQCRSNELAPRLPSATVSSLSSVCSAPASPEIIPSGHVPSVHLLSALCSIHDHLLSIVAALIDHVHSHSRASHASSPGHLIKMTRETVDKVQQILGIICAVCDHPAIVGPERVALSAARGILHGAAGALIKAIGRMLAPDSLNQEKEEKTLVVQAATGTLQAGGDCVTAVRNCLTRRTGSEVRDTPVFNAPAPPPSVSGQTRSVQGVSPKGSKPKNAGGQRYALYGLVDPEAGPSNHETELEQRKANQDTSEATAAATTMSEEGTDRPMDNQLGLNGFGNEDNDVDTESLMIQPDVVHGLVASGDDDQVFGEGLDRTPLSPPQISAPLEEESGKEGSRNHGETAEVFDGVSFKGRDSAIIDDGESQEENEYEHEEDTRTRDAEVLKPETGVGHTSTDEETTLYTIPADFPEAAGEPFITTALTRPTTEILQPPVELKHITSLVHDPESSKHVEPLALATLPPLDMTRLSSLSTWKPDELDELYKLYERDEPDGPIISSVATHVTSPAPSPSPAHIVEPPALIAPRMEQERKKLEITILDRVLDANKNDEGRDLVEKSQGEGAPHNSQSSKSRENLSVRDGIDECQPTMSEGVTYPALNKPPPRTFVEPQGKLSAAPAGGNLQSGVSLSPAALHTKVSPESIPDASTDHAGGVNQDLGETNEAPDALQSNALQALATAMYESLIQQGCTDLKSSMKPHGFSSSAIAEGGFGDIWAGRHQDGTKLAIKVLRFTLVTDDIAKKQIKRVTREIYNWSKLEHENIHQLMGVIVFRERLGMVSKWMEHGNLRQYLSKNS